MREKAGGVYRSCRRSGAEAEAAQGTDPWGAPAPPTIPAGSLGLNTHTGARLALGVASAMRGGLENAAHQPREKSRDSG